jgi:hypothetical protein
VRVAEESISRDSERAPLTQAGGGDDATAQRRADAAGGTAADARRDRSTKAGAESTAAPAGRSARSQRAAAKRREAAAAATAKSRTPSAAREIAQNMLPAYGWSQSEFTCLDALWIGESDWQWNADNPTSSAYGIPQSLPGEKMATAGADWLTNPATQIEWGLGYIRDVYGTPCAANSFKIANNWY